MKFARSSFLIAFVLLCGLIGAQPVQPAAQPAAQSAALRAVVISEIAWMGTAVSANDEWIELYNNTPAAIDLTGWTLAAADGAPAITLSGVIPAGGHYLLERTDDDSAPGVPADQIYTGALGDAGETLLLRDAGGTLVDEVDAAAGWFSGHKEARVPMARVAAAGEGSDPANWTYNPRCGSATNSAGAARTCELTPVVVGQGLETAVYFNERAVSADAVTMDVTPMEQALLDLIHAAAATIDVALFDLNRSSVVNALLAAHNRGVTVRVVGDDEEAAKPAYSASYTALSDGGIPLRNDAHAALQHNKFMVFDGQTVWTGSTNFSDTGLTLNANNSLVITSPHLAAAYTAEFEEMWYGRFHTAKSDNTSHLFDFNGVRVESYFSPTDLPAFAVWSALGAAQQSIHFAMFAWTDVMLAQQTMARMADGVAVRGVWEDFSGKEVRDLLCSAGAQIATEDLPGRVHHKFAVIDAFGENPVVITGSYNWSHGGAYANDENTLIIHDAALAQAYVAEWQRLATAVSPERYCNLFRAFLPFTTNSP